LARPIKGGVGYSGAYHDINLPLGVKRELPKGRPGGKRLFEGGCSRRGIGALSKVR